PLIFGWDGPVDFDLPAVLCRKLANAELDVAFVSSFEFLEHPIYTIADRVAVGSDGPVSSVLLVHRAPLAHVTEIVLDPASRTSVHLLRCLLAENNLTPRLVDDGEITETRARLFIGDAAIRFRAKHVDAFRYRDLGQWWKELTGLPFVFALWLIRPEVEDAHAIADALRNRRDANLRALDQLIAAEPEFSPEFCRHYFTDCLRFDFGAREQAGLLKFRALCERHGILAPNPAPLRLA
ncbi:MAG: menaquinone biosynthesis protein, partial [Verrucomicrobiota bacterium]|nr:menaquinone biosynthesis protein [Verrucomicrobiota bacterium]